MNSEFHECLLCSSGNLKTLPVYAAFHLVRCRNCGFVFSKKIPSLQQLSDHYKLYPRHNFISPITIKRYEELLEILEPHRKSNRILDVGCGGGFFLAVAKQKGWEVYGTEYSDEDIVICEGKGITMFKGKLNDSPFAAKSFDVITSFEVLEHINNPEDEISKFNELLRDGGIVYLTTPNFNSLNRYLLKAKFNILSYPDHLCYYTAKTINFLFNKHHFSKIKIQTTGFSITRLKMSMKISDQAVISSVSDDEVIRNKVEKSSLLRLSKTLLNSFLSITKKGDTLKVLFKKV